MDSCLLTLPPTANSRPILPIPPPILTADLQLISPIPLPILTADSQPISPTPPLTIYKDHLIQFSSTYSDDNTKACVKYIKDI